MVDASGAAVLPGEAFLFVPGPRVFGLGKLNAFAAQVRGYKMDFFYGERFSYMTTEDLYSYNNGGCLLGGCFAQGGLPFCA